jgi:glycine hydroxymethyltransferase
MHVIAAKAAAFKEANSDSFRQYSQQTINNAKALCNRLIINGFNIVSGGTDCHMVLIDLTTKEVTGKLAEESLDRAGITCNKNAIPFDKQSPFVTSGIRVGTAAGTTRGFKEIQFEFIADCISKVIDVLSSNDEILINKVEISVLQEIRKLCQDFPIYK